MDCRVLNSVSEDGKASKIADLSVLMPGLFGGTDAKEKSTATSSQVTYSEEPIVAIPPHTAKYFFWIFNIWNSLP